MISEKAFLNEILCEISALPQTLVHRQNTGTAWQGEPLDLPVGHTVRVQPGMKILAKARPISFGIVGGGDVAGCHRGIPLQIETKTLTGRQRDVQVSFGRAWEKAGGLYILARTMDDIRAGLKRYSTSS